MKRLCWLVVLVVALMVQGCAVYPAGGYGPGYYGGYPAYGYSYGYPGVYVGPPVLGFGYRGGWGHGWGGGWGGRGWGGGHGWGGHGWRH